MALNFPQNPSNGDTYEGYVYDATAGVWNSDPHQIASRFVTSATAPSSPSEGDGWFDTNTAKSYVYYDGVWVQLGALGTVDLNQIADVNVSSPANGESLVYDGTEWVNQNVTVEPTEIYDVSTNSTGKFALPSGTTAERPETPNAGDIRFNTEAGEPEWYSQSESRWVLFRQSPTDELEYLVIAGGGGGGRTGTNYGSAGAGGAGGYRSSIVAESSGGGTTAESRLTFSLGQTFNIEIGAGGNGGGSTYASCTSGSDSVFGTIVSSGGGRGADPGGTTPGGFNAESGGSGGGATSGNSPGSGTAGQGYSGGAGSGGNYTGGGGGGAAGVGANGLVGSAPDSGGLGGAGLSSNVTGTSVTRAAGGSAKVQNVAGTGNTGNGGSCAQPGGSGIVIIKYPASYTAITSVGLSSSTNTLGDFKVTTFTSGTGTVTLS